MSSQTAASIATSVIFGVLFIACIANFRLTKFRAYLLSGASAVFRCIGFAFRGAYFSAYDGGDPNENYIPTYYAFSQAGYGISIAVLCLVMGSWFKNASEAAKPSFAKGMTLSIAVRFIILPIIVFGPISGIAVASLAYGAKTPDALAIASTWREASTWGLWGAALLLFLVILFGSVTMLHGWRTRSIEHLDMLILVSLFCSFWEVFASSSRVAALYHSDIQAANPISATNPALYFPLVVLPEFVELFTICIPRLLAKMGMAAKYPTWQAQQFGGDGIEKSNGSRAEVASDKA